MWESSPSPDSLASCTVGLGGEFAFVRHGRLFVLGVARIEREAAEEKKQNKNLYEYAFCRDY